MVLPTPLIALIILFVSSHGTRSFDRTRTARTPRILKPLVSTDSTIRLPGKLEARSGVELTRRICNPPHNRFVNAPNFCFQPAHPLYANAVLERNETELRDPDLGKVVLYLNWSLFPSQYQATLLIT